MKKLLILCSAMFIAIAGFCQLTVQGLTTEHLYNPIGIDEKIPRFSWQIQGSQRNIVQNAYEIKVSAGKKAVWNSGQVKTDQSVHIPYAGASLESGKKYNWQVRVWGKDGKASAWSPVASFQMGLLNKEDWKANWIEAGFTQDDANRPAVYFRKKFTANKKIAHATAFITAHGIYEAQINGKRVGDYYLTPGWTSYKKRLQYQAYDVTNLLTNGENAMGISVGNGWYKGFLAWDNNKDIYGKTLGVLAQINIAYADGTTDIVYTDGNWKSSTGAVKFAEIYHGETIDAREEKIGWATATYNDNSWSGVKELQDSKDNLIATYNEPIRKHEQFKAIKVIKTPKGENVIDFGQNLVGWVIVKAKGSAGTKISIHHAEVLDKAGNFYTDNMRAAKVLAQYILKGEGEEIFEPHFTFYGFRYIKIDGYPGEINPDNFTAVALYSDMKKTGELISSHALINQLQQNIQWGQRGNFLDVPTDCPQRDERLGWTGDAQAFSRTAAFNFGVNNFFTKWMKDVEADQLPNGSVPFVVPNVLGPGASGSTGWADVANIIPWNIYLAYGDKRILENQYNSMKKWVGYMQSNSKDNLWNKGFHFGDWLFYRPFDDNDGNSAVTDKYLIAQCFFAHSTQLVINAAKVLGKEEDVNQYQQLLQQIKDAYIKEYLTPNGRLVSGTQTAYVLALNFDMLPENLRTQAAKKLADNVKAYGTHLTTGFLGTPYLCHVLSRFGYSDLAYDLLFQETYPSWLYPVKMGATTIWERWDGIKPDSTFQTPGMNSFNHYAYGAIGDWMYRVAAGLDTYEDGPGYKHIRIKPIVGGKFEHVKASLNTYYGEVSSAWKKEAGKITYTVVVPGNTRATVILKEGKSILCDGSPVDKVSDLKVLGQKDGEISVELGSGTYVLEVTQ